MSRAESAERTTATGIIAYWAVMVMFPIFLILQLITALGIFSIGGSFGLLGLLFAIILGIPFLAMILRRRPKRQAYFIGAFLILWATVALIIAFNAIVPPAGLETSKDFPSAIRAHIGAVIYWYTLFLAGLYWGNFGKTNKRLIFVIFAAITIAMLATAQILLILFHPGNEEGAGTYQHIARSVSVIGILALAYCQSAITVLIAYVLLIVQLFFIGARSEFAGIFALAPILFLIYCRDIRSRIFLVMITASIVAALLSIFAQDIAEAIQSSRQSKLLDLSDDNSWLARQKLLAQGLDRLLDNPIFGDFSGEIIIGGLGKYIHNILSVWQQYGLIPFLLFTGLLIYGTADSLDALFIRKQRDPLVQLAVFFNVTSLLLLVAAKSVFWPVVAFGWGLSAQLAARPLGNRSLLRWHIRESTRTSAQTTPGSTATG